MRNQDKKNLEAGALSLYLPYTIEQQKSFKRWKLLNESIGYVRNMSLSNQTNNSKTNLVLSHFPSTHLLPAFLSLLHPTGLASKPVFMDNVVP